MVGAPVVNGIVVVGDNTWIGGGFSDVEDQSGNKMGEDPSF